MNRGKAKRKATGARLRIAPTASARRAVCLQRHQLHRAWRDRRKALRPDPRRIHEALHHGPAGPGAHAIPAASLVDSAASRLRSTSTIPSRPACRHREHFPATPCCAASCTIQPRGAWAAWRVMRDSSAPPTISRSMPRVCSIGSQAAPASFLCRASCCRRWSRPNSPPPARRCADSAGTSTRPIRAIAARCFPLAPSATQDSQAHRCGSIQPATAM